MMPVGNPIPDFKRLMLVWADVFDYPDWALTDKAMARMIRHPGFWRQQMQARQPRGADPAAWPASFTNDRRRYIAETAAAYLYREDAEQTYLRFPLVAGQLETGITLSRTRGTPTASVTYWNPQPGANPATAAVQKFIYGWEQWQRFFPFESLDDFVDRVRNALPIVDDGLSYGSWEIVELEIPDVQTIPNREAAAVIIYLILDVGMRWEKPRGGLGGNTRARFIRSQLKR